MPVPFGANSGEEQAMSRISHRCAVLVSIVVGFAWTGASAAPPTPPNAGLAAEVSALQTQVTTLTAQVSALTGQLGALSSAVSTLQTSAGAVQVWKDAHVGVAVQRNDATFVDDWTLSTMASVSLPAGTYLVVAKTAVLDPVVSASTFFCRLVRSSGLIDESMAYSVSDEPETMSLQAVVTLPSADAVALKCGASGPESAPGSAESGISQIAAIRAEL